MLYEVITYRRSRIRLTEVSRDFVRYNEEDIKQAYEKATQLQLDLLIYREKEMYLKARRDELQKRVRGVEKSVERAEIVSAQMGVVLEYLSGELGQVTRILESAKNRQMLGLKIILAVITSYSIHYTKLYEREIDGMIIV